MLRKKAFWIALVAVIVLGGGGYAAYRFWLMPKQTADAGATLRTATATIGNISITTTGSGTLVASQTANLAFGVSATVKEVLVKVGDHVQEGDVLARADDTAARQTLAEDQQAVIDAQISLELAQGQAELAVSQAEADLATAQKALDALVNWSPDSVELATAKANLANAQVSYQSASKKAGMVDEQNASVRISLDQAISALDSAQQSYADAMNPERDWERDIETTRQNAAASLVRAQQNLEIAQADYDLAMVDTSGADVQSAWAQVLSAKETVTNLEEAPTADEIAVAQAAVKSAELTLQQAKLELGDGDQAVAQNRAELTLEQAKLNAAAAQDVADGMVIVAPFSGTVVAVNFKAGETASGTAIAISDLDTPVVEFWADETDMSSVAIGNAVSIVFSALPDLTYSGQIYQVDPQLVTVSNTPAVQAWATLDTSTQATTLLADMNADISIIAGEADNVVLVPVEAVRSLGNGQHMVFVVQADGTLEMRQVEIGLSDYVNTEIMSGLTAGEVVTLNSSSSSTTSQSTQTGNQAFPGGGGVFVGPIDGGGFQGGRP